MWHLELVYNFPCDGVEKKEGKAAVVAVLVSSIFATFSPFIPFPHKWFPEWLRDFVWRSTSADSLGCVEKKK